MQKREPSELNSAPKKRWPGPVHTIFNAAIPVWHHSERLRISVRAELRL
ncbi:MAG: hypothetical protein HQL54_07570 [Magnetococcales bacterium]|nr:hypothetical protein [Magnetococcales bacterium]